MVKKSSSSGLRVALPLFTADGTFLAHYSDQGLAGLDFPKIGRVSSVTAKNISLQIRHWHRLTLAALKNVLAGRQAGQLPPLDWSGTTDFQQSVWREMLKLKPGQTRSYGEMAERIGRPRAVRAVGSACGANPFPVLVPCHRVLAANQQIGGFGGGLDWKRRLLAREGVVPA